MSGIIRAAEAQQSTPQALARAVHKAEQELGAAAAALDTAQARYDRALTRLAEARGAAPLGLVHLRSVTDEVLRTGRSAHPQNGEQYSDVVGTIAAAYGRDPVKLQAMVEAYADSGLTPEDFVAAFTA